LGLSGKKQRQTTPISVGTPQRDKKILQELYTKAPSQMENDHDWGTTSQASAAHRMAVQILIERFDVTRREPTIIDNNSTIDREISLPALTTHPNCTEKPTRRGTFALPSAP